MKSITGLLIITCFMISCTAEKVSLSPVQSSLVHNGVEINISTKEIDEKSEAYFHISEMTNILNTFPTSTNKEIGKELGILKFNIKEYVYATEAYNVVGRERALKNIEKSYKKIQQLRNRFSKEENEEVNAYLVRIKTHLTKLEALR